MGLSTSEILVIVIVILVLFGAKKIPELMKGLGKGVKMFKQGMNDIEEEVKRPLDEQQAPQQPSEEQQDGK